MADFARTVSDNVRVVSEKMSSIGMTFKETGETVCEVGGEIGNAFERIRGVFDGVYKSYKAVEENLKGMGKFVDSLSNITTVGDKTITSLQGFGSKLTGLLNPKGLVLAGVVLLIGYFVNLVKNCEDMQQKLIAAWEKIRNFIAPVIEFIGGLIEKVFGWIQGFIYEHGESIRKVFELVWEAISLIVGTVIEVVRNIIGKYIGIITAIWDAFGDTILNHIRIIWGVIEGVFSSALDIIKGIFDFFIGIFTGDWERAWEGIQNIVGGAIDIITGILSGIVDIGRNLIEGLWNGISSMATWIADKIRGFFDNILGGVRRFLGIRSPSRVFADQVGKMIAQGVACGIEDEAHVAENAAVKMAEDMLNPKVEVFADKFERIKNIVVTALEKMSRMAYQIVRAMTAMLDTRLMVDGRTIGRNFFRALGEGLIDEEARLMAEALRVSDALKDIFRSREAAALGFGAQMAMAHEMSSMGNRNNEFHLNFYGVKEKQTAYEVYRAAQRIAWGAKE